jgi:hypothetical protein
MNRNERLKTDALTRAVDQVAGLRVAEADLERLIARALHWGATWAEIAAVLGVTRQSAHERYRRLRYDPAAGVAWHEPPLPL